jgi:hypothetical protein
MQTMCAKLEFVLFYTTNLQKFLANNFSGCTFSKYFHGFEISVKFCVFLILICKRRNKNLLESGMA